MEVERKNKEEEREYMQQMMKEHPELQPESVGGPGAPAGGGGGPPKFPIPSGLPPGASKHASDENLSIPQEFIAELETVANQENMIHIDDVIRVVDSIKAEKTGVGNKLGIAEDTFRIPRAGKGLLAGEEF
jgi:hypothetical protein